MRLFSMFSATLLASVLLSACIGGGGPATAMFVATPGEGGNVQFDASTSGGKIAKYEWNFGDMTENGTGKAVSHTYQYLNGQYNVCLTVTGDDGKKDQHCDKVQVGSGRNSDPMLFMKANKRWVAPNEQVIFDATQSYDADGDPVHFVWDFNSKTEERDFKGMDNMGPHQYGIYKYGPPPSTGASASSGGNASGGSLLTPSGYDLKEELAKAQQRADELFGNLTFHVAPPPPPEPRNSDFDGRIDDTSPVQIFQFPSAATYFVVVKVVDIKGSSSEGYIRIKVADGRPNDMVYDNKTGKLDSGTLSAAEDNGAPFTTWAAINYTVSFPANATFTLTYTPQLAAGASAKVNGYVCGASLDYGQCSKNARHKQLGWASGSDWKYNIVPEDMSPPPDSFVAIKLYVQNDPDSGQSPVDWAVKTVMKLDINPWFLEESGNLVFTG